MQTTNYFQHDYRSRLDKKLLKVRMKHQMTGVGVYWSLVEMLHENDGILDMDIEMIAYELQTDEEIITDVINICFEYEDGNIISKRVIKNLEYRKMKHLESVNKGRKGAEKRWGKSNSNSSSIVQLKNKYSTSIVNYSKEKDKEKDKEKVKEKDIDKKTTTVSNSGSNKNITEKILDKLINPEIDLKQYNIAIEDFHELGGIDGISDIMNWDESTKNNWYKRIMNVNQLM